MVSARFARAALGREGVKSLGVCLPFARQTTEASELPLPGVAICGNGSSRYSGAGEEAASGLEE